MRTRATFNIYTRSYSKRTRLKHQKNAKRKKRKNVFKQAPKTFLCNNNNNNLTPLKFNSKWLPRVNRGEPGCIL